MVDSLTGAKPVNQGAPEGDLTMSREEVIGKARQYLLKTSLLSDIVPAEEGPVIARGDASLVWDTEGKSYLDFNSGQMCSTLGHNNARIQRTIAEQSKILTHASTVYYNYPQVELAERIASINDAPLRKSVFGESGSDSNEMAVLIARRATNRSAVGALSQGFHGLSDSTRAISYAAAASGYGPPMPDVSRVSLRFSARTK